jgi:hypothetical protein
VPSANFITYCPIFFSDLPALASSCHAQDQATTVLHEETHAPGVYSPGTQDLGYGYAAATRLSASQALNNADTYALYANGKLPILQSCQDFANMLCSYLPQLLEALKIGCQDDGSYMQIDWTSRTCHHRT